MLAKRKIGPSPEKRSTTQTTPKSFQHRSFLFLPLCAGLALGIVVRTQWQRLTDVSVGGSPAASSAATQDRTDHHSTAMHLLDALLLPREKPQVVWLLSFPNSGTSYTLALVEQASNRSIASNYGVEFTNEENPEPIPVHSKYPQGPFWQGLDSDFRFGSRVRPLPDSFILTKTHCGGRCINCSATSYLSTGHEFLKACERTTFRKATAASSGSDSTTTSGSPRYYEGILDKSRVARAVHLIRDPLDNVVSRFHLDVRHMNKKALTKNKRERFAKNATGFKEYCQYMDSTFPLESEAAHIWADLKQWPNTNKHRPRSRRELRTWLREIPCRGEFVKYVRWHDHIVHTVLPALGKFPETGLGPVLTLYYEDYGHDLPVTVRKIFEFLELTDVVGPNQTSRKKRYRPFRMTNYSNHYSGSQKRAIVSLLRGLATPETWNLIQHYGQEWV